MELKLEGRASTAGDIPGISGPTTSTKRRLSVCWKQFPTFKMFLITATLLCLSNRDILLVEGNSESIESCVRVMHSGQNQNSGLSLTNNGRLGGNNLVSEIGNSGGGGGLGSNSGSGSGGSLPSTSSGTEHSVIACHIRTLHPDLDLENLTSSIPTGNGNGMMVDVMTITRLKLVCNDVLFFESAVSTGQLSSLSELHELTIENCKLQQFPKGFLAGLRNLRKLRINTGNSEWAARSLEIAPGAFTSVPKLRHLHLGFNHMWSLPDRLLCEVGSLQSLNFTHNLLSEIDDLGLPGNPLALNEYSSSGASSFASRIGSSTTTTSSLSGGSTCLGDLKYLDLSHNNIRTLGSRRLEVMTSLLELRLQNNLIAEISESVFGGLSDLRLLNLSSNRLVALPAKVFQPCKLLKQLYLQNMSLSALPPGLLDGLEHLEVLDVSFNSLSSQLVNENIFHGLIRLVILKLNDNNLVHVTPFTRDLSNLQMLDLGNNLITSIDDYTFKELKNLHSLTLTRNRLASIKADTFNGLYMLHKLIADYNQIETIEKGAFRNLTSLQDLFLAGNLLTEIPVTLSDVPLLRTLDLGQNRFSSLSNESFAGLANLYGLRFVDNKITELPHNFCQSLKKLRVLNLSQNLIRKIEFFSCSELKVIRLDSNLLDELPATLATQLPNLLWMNISSNRLRFVDYNLLPSSLEFFDVSYNQIESLGGAWTKSNLATGSGGNEGGQENTNRISPYQNVRLRVVDASHNKLTSLDFHAVPASLEVLNLSHNRLKRIAPNTFSRNPSLRRVELVSNQLETVPLNALRLPIIAPGRPLPEFFLGGNPFLCDCEMEWMTRINQLSGMRQHPNVLDLDTIVCRLAYGRTATHIPLPDIKPQEFLCPYKSHCFHLCHCCEFDACDCEMTCPGNCTCYHDDTWSANVVNCAGMGHNVIPARLPMDSTEVYLDGNNIPVLKSHTFIGRKNLRLLYLNSTGLQQIQNLTWNGLKVLEVLILKQNKLETLSGFEFEGLTKLRILDLSDNNLRFISNITFLPLKSLEMLSLKNNRLQTFSVYQFSLNAYLVEISLSSNPWNCDCQFLHQFYNWVTDNSKKVVDFGKLQCVWNTTHKPGPHLIDYNRTCGSSWALMGIDGSGFDLTTYSPLSLVMGGVSLVLLLVIIVILVILCRDNARIWIFSHFGIRMCPSGTYAEEDDKLYDAYLLYSQKDEEFVAQKVADELESNDSYRLCLHYRDLLSETGDLKEMMIGAVENSKSVVIILSRNFLQGEWSSGEYRGAFHAVLKKSQKQNRDLNPKKVVIVFIDDIPPMDINPDIRSWVRHNRIQVIKWSLSSQDHKKHRKFWSKLKYSLPAPSSHYHSNITSNTTTTSSTASSGTVGGGGETHGGILATLKYTTNGNNENDQIIVDELSRTMTMNINNKLWPYATNFVALPPKNQIIPHSPGSQGGYGHGQQGHYNNHNQINYHHTSPSHHHHYHTPLPVVSNPPKSPPSSQSTDSTTTTNGGDDMVHTPTSFSLMMHQMQMQGKSPLPVPKSLLYNTNNSSGGVISSGNGGSSGAGGGGESYLSLEGEHVYSTLDPPSPQPHQQQQQNSNRVLNNIHLPNGYTYQPQPHPQWHLANNTGGNVNHHPSGGGGQTPKGTMNFGSSKSYKQKDGKNPVQTYLV